MGPMEQTFYNGDMNHLRLYLSTSGGTSMQLETKQPSDPEKYLESFLWIKWQLSEKAVSFSSKMEW